uniref:DnaJ homolog subfamily C member 1-like n=1 Tax=Sinocyclocheilus anshuiensis TaxID=1608454 RepID=A0A671MJD7_9TELE
EFLSVNQDASSSEIRKAYRKLSLTLHPDKNKDENAENQFRQLVAIYEVLKDEERRQRYDDILVNGLPDWRQPVFYYRRVRKMSNGELGFLLFLILTVGHYAVIWSIYLEKQLDELLSRKKREKKKKQSSKMTDEIKSLVKKPKVEFPVYEPNTNAAFVPVYDQGTSIDDIEDQMDYWLEDKKQQKTKTQEWTEEDLSQLSRCMAKFPGGMPGWWEKIAHELGRSVTEVNLAVTVPDSLMTQREEPLEQQLEDSAEPAGAEDSESKALRRRTKKSAAGSAGTGEAEERMKGRRQRDFDPTAVDDDSEDEKKPSASKEKPSAAEDVWTQNQQKLLELALQQFPCGTTERWDKIAKVVPGKTKEECMSRYKLLTELIQKRKQAKS